MANIITLSEAEKASKFWPGMKVWHCVLAAGDSQELIWAKFEPDGNYPMHSHPYEQTSVVIQGRLRLTVGDEVREVGPGDMWFAPAGVPHGGEILGDEPLIFIDVYSPPSGGGDEQITFY
ncbi:MAG: cupin domain-containing protein [Pseudomonadota bacterium]